MKIIQVMPEFGLAGAETMCENLIYELVKLGHDVTVVSMYDYHSSITDRLENAGIEIVYLHKKSGFDLSMVFKMKKIFKKYNPDVIHTHRYCPQYAIPAAILAGIKHRVHTVHNVAEKENGRIARKLNKFFFKHCGVIPVALSELIRDSIIKEYGINKEKIPVIYNGIDLSKCIPKQAYESHNIFKILHIGRFTEQKNHIGLLKAFKSFNDKYPNSELWLIGDGETKDTIKDFVHSNDLERNVIFCGLKEDVYDYLNQADVFVLPSNYEGLPMTLIEAMGTGLPIIATAVGGVPDMLTDGENAVLISPKSEEIAYSLIRLHNDVNFRKSIGQKALISSNSFSSKIMTKHYLKTFMGDL